MVVPASSFSAGPVVLALATRRGAQMVRNQSKLEELLCKQRERKAAPCPSRVCNKLSQYILEGLVKPFHQSVCLGVVWACPDSCDAKLSDQLPHEPQNEVSALVHQDLLLYSYPGEKLNVGMDDLWCGDCTQWKSFWIPCCVVTDYQDVPITCTAFIQWPYNVHSNPLKSFRNHRERRQVCSAPLGHSTGFLT